MNKLQAKIGELMEMSPHGKFHADDILSSLDEHDDLWLSFLWVSCTSRGILLKSLADGRYEADTLLILCPNLQVANELANIALDPDGVWHADDAVFILREPKGRNEWQLDGARCILKVWWD